MEECTNIKGGGEWGVEGTPASCIWFTRPFLFCPPLVLRWKTWLPGVPPLLPPPPSPLKSLCYVHSCTVHITSAAPSYSPTTAPPRRPAIVEHAPPPPRGNSFFHFTRARGRPDAQAWDTRTDWWAHAFFLLSFPFFSYHSISSPSLHPEKNPLAL